MKWFVILFVIVVNANYVRAQTEVITGAEQTDKYLPFLVGKKVGMMGNQTSMCNDRHLIDILFENDIDLRFALVTEHGFRGDVERGERVNNDVDTKTDLPLFSLYGVNNKIDSLMESIDVIIYDIQDAGTRFNTKTASLHRMMQLCVRHGKPFILLDRPNPNGDQVDGPVRKDDKFKSDVAFHKIPIMHGLTHGELAQMINGEKWLENEEQCDLHVITLKGYTHKTLYRPPVFPSPSLTNYIAIRLYGSLCLFEGTDISVGRGTDFPFQQIGYPDTIFGDYEFTPESRTGMNLHVENQGKICYGIDLRTENPETTKFTLKYILDFYKKSQQIEDFKFFKRPDFFNKLAGNSTLQEQIIAGLSEEQIRESWKEDLIEYKKTRKKYLLYEDFE